MHNSRQGSVFCVMAHMCHAAAYFLGNTTQSNSSIYYICPYIAKNKVSADTVVTTFEKATDDVVRNPSIAADTGTPLRTVSSSFVLVAKSHQQRSVHTNEDDDAAC
jgi:hypothetical protein